MDFLFSQAREVVFLASDPNSPSLLYFILTAATTITSILFGAMVKARNDQLKEKDRSFKIAKQLQESVIKAKNDDIAYKEKLISEQKADISALQDSNIELLSQVVPALKTTQDVLKELTVSFNQLHNDGKNK